uniref:Uncharacterized protein n=1 Tax=mine drainage metagenome TaxID=410659 RepID=E6QB46_9ZZZZ
MDINRFDKLLGGENPTPEEYAQFVYVINKLPWEALWTILISNIQMSNILKSVVNKELHDKLPGQVIGPHFDRLIENVWNRYKSTESK